MMSVGPGRICSAVASGGRRRRGREARPVPHSVRRVASGAGGRGSERAAERGAQAEIIRRRRRKGTERVRLRVDIVTIVALPRGGCGAE
mmetsp:Transcript_40396/g.79045  ORF Transcript_40396/g.79045 Transcript_40396/m.79045 type:complete len:89 (+) Transcript_40396:521-787(+)